MEITEKKNVDYFEKELALLSDHNKTKEIVKKALNEVSPQFFLAPASTSGKFHPDYAQGEGGLLRHTQAAVWFAKELFTTGMWSFDELNQDLILGALILHDTCKCGVTWGTHYRVDHPILVRKLLFEEELSDVEIMYWDSLNELIESHMGKWNNNGKLPTPQTEAQKFVHLCDFLASRKEISLSFFQPENKQENAEEDISLVKLATPRQLNYIDVLRKQAKGLGRDIAKYQQLADDLTMGQASVVISELKVLIG